MVRQSYYNNIKYWFMQVRKRFFQVTGAAISPVVTIAGFDGYE